MTGADLASPPAGIRIRNAGADDLEPVRELVRGAGLPDLEPHPRLADLFVAETDDEVLVGSVHLEMHARIGLLRGFVVHADRRGIGIGRELLISLRSRAHELGLRELFALTASAGPVLQRLGFREIPRERAPAELRASRAYRELYPDTASLLRLEL